MIDGRPLKKKLIKWAFRSESALFIFKRTKNEVRVAPFVGSFDH